MSDFIKSTEVVSGIPKDVGSNDTLIKNPITIFGKFIQLIITRKINIALLLLTKYD